MSKTLIDDKRYTVQYSVSGSVIKMTIIDKRYPSTIPIILSSEHLMQLLVELEIATNQKTQ